MPWYDPVPRSTIVELFAAVRVIVTLATGKRILIDCGDPRNIRCLLDTDDPDDCSDHASGRGCMLDASVHPENVSRKR